MKSNLRNLTRKQLAHRLGVCLESIKRWEKSGRLAPIRFSSRTIRYPLKYVEKIEAEGLAD